MVIIALLLNMLLNPLALGADFTNYLGTQFKTIPPGSFFMGSCPRPSQKAKCLAEGNIDLQATDYELPQHKVTLTYSFQISQHEITFEQFMPFAKEQEPHLLTEDFLEHNEPGKPVVLVSWRMVKRYIDWLNENKPFTDMGIYRLPSEAEWEYAARGGTQSIYWWGNKMEFDQENCNGCNEHWGPHPILKVGSLNSNPFGLYDMTGNVSEWVADCWNHNYISAPINGAVWNTGDCWARVIRGGSRNEGTSAVRVAFRQWNSQDYRDVHLGFRLVRMVESPI